MALTEIGRRTIGLFGILDLETLNHPIHGTSQEWTRLQVWLVLRRPAFNTYQNLEWNPNKGFHARCTIAATGDLGLTNPPILKDKGMEYEIELVYEWEDDARVTNLLIGCGTEKILQSFSNFAIALGQPPLTYIPLPIPPPKRCPVSIVRVSCVADSLVDIVVFAENAIALFNPADIICNNSLPTPVADAVPSPLDPNNSRDTTPDIPSDDPIPDSPYDPPTGDQGETPQPLIPVPLEGQLAKIIFNSMVSTCANRIPYPIIAELGGYQTPATGEYVLAAPCQADGEPSYDLKITHGGINVAYPITNVVLRPPFSIVYYYP